MLSTLIWLRQTHISFGENEVLQSWWCHRAMDWSIPFWSGLGSITRWRTFWGHFNAQWCSAGIRDRPTPVSPFREWPSKFPRSTERCTLWMILKMVTQRTQFSNCCMGLVEETGPTEQSYEMKLSHNWVRSSLRLPFFHQWVWHPNACFQISQGSRGSDR